MPCQRRGLIFVTYWCALTEGRVEALTKCVAGPRVNSCVCPAIGQARHSNTLLSPPECQYRKKLTCELVYPAVGRSSSTPKHSAFAGVRGRVQWKKKLTCELVYLAIGRARHPNTHSAVSSPERVVALYRKKFVGAKCLPSLE